MRARGLSDHRENSWPGGLEQCDQRTYKNVPNIISRQENKNRAPGSQVTSPRSKDSSAEGQNVLRDRAIGAVARRPGGWGAGDLVPGESVHQHFSEPSLHVPWEPSVCSCSRWLSRGQNVHGPQKCSRSIHSGTVHEQEK